MAESGKTYDQRHVFIFKLRDGKIVPNREHVNPLAFMKALG